MGLIWREGRLAASQRAGQTISSFASCLAERIAQASSDSIAETLFELLDVLLVGGRDLVDLICEALAQTMPGWRQRADL